MVNNAGVKMDGEIELMTLGLLQKVMDINFFGTVRVTKAFLPLIRESRGIFWSSLLRVKPVRVSSFLDYLL